MNQNITLAVGVIILSITIATTTSVLLGRARATLVSRRELTHSIPPTLSAAPYLAAFVTLVALLAMAVGGGGLVFLLLSTLGPFRYVAAVITGVVMFAAVGGFFARLADLAEVSRVKTLARMAAIGAGGEPAPSNPTTAGHVVSHQHELAGRLQAGWIYRDRKGLYLLGARMASAPGEPLLLRLPSFTVVGAADVAYPLVAAGPGELAVLGPGTNEPPASSKELHAGAQEAPSADTVDDQRDS